MDVFDEIEADHKTASGRALVKMARSLYGKGTDRDVKNALAALRLAREHEQNDLAKRLKRLEDRHGEKGRARETANRLRDRKRVAGGNVVEFPTKDSI